VRDTVIRQLAREPPGWRPATLAVTIRRYRCAGCPHVWRQDTPLAAGPRATLPRRGLRRAPEAITSPWPGSLRVSASPGTPPATPSRAEGKRALIDDTTRFGGVTAIGAGEHVRRHTRRGGTYVTVITGLTGIRDGTGPARLPDMVQGRSQAGVQDLG
jgi:transposase